MPIPTANLSDDRAAQILDFASRHSVLGYPWLLVDPALVSGNFYGRPYAIILTDLDKGAGVIVDERDLRYFGGIEHATEAEHASIFRWVSLVFAVFAIGTILVFGKSELTKTALNVLLAAFSLFLIWLLIDQVRGRMGLRSHLRARAHATVSPDILAIVRKGAKIERRRRKFRAALPAIASGIGQIVGTVIGLQTNAAVGKLAEGATAVTLEAVLVRPEEPHQKPGA